MRKLLLFFVMFCVSVGTWATNTITKDKETEVDTIQQTSAGEIGVALCEPHNHIISDADDAIVNMSHISLGQKNMAKV